MVPKNLFCGPWLAGDLSEAQKERLDQTAATHGINADRLLFRGALQNHGVQVLNPPRDFRPAAQDFVQFFHFLVQRRGALEIQFLTGLFALFLESGSQRAAAGYKELHQAIYFDVVFFLRAARKARREAHFHFRINTAGKQGIAANLDLTPPNLEKIQRALSKSLRSAAGREWAVVRT